MPGATKWTASGHRRGWCPYCERWKPLTSTGKFKRHEKRASDGHEVKP